MSLPRLLRRAASRTEQQQPPADRRDQPGYAEGYADASRLAATRLRWMADTVEREMREVGQP